MKKPNNERAEARLPWGAFAVRAATPAAWPRRALGALALLAGLVASGGAAAGVIGVLQGSPLVVSAGSATAVTFSVSITDTNYREGSGNIQRMKADGSVLSVVGNLRDDGLQGDAVAGDRIYSLRVDVQEAAAGSVSFRASAAYRNEIKRTFSNLVTLTVNPAGPAPVIDAAALSPAGTGAGLALVSTVTATIVNEQLIAGSAVLQKLAADGSVLGSVGSLRDDGQEGDVSAGDRTYTVRTTVLEDTPGVVNYRVAANFQGYAQPVYSPLLPVNITGTATGVNIAAPANGAYLNTPVVTVSGSVGDASAQVSINGIVTPVSNNGFAAAVPLNEGPNTVTAVATNSNGTTSTRSILITLDTTAPRIQIYSPGVTSSTTAASVTVTGLINDIVVGTVNPQQATVTVNGINASVVNRSFQANNVPLNLGSNTLQAVATDRAGNFATTSVALTRVAATGQASLSLASGNNQSGAVSAHLPAPLVARLVDGQGQPQVGRPVVFRILSQDGSLSPQAAAPAGQSAVAINTDAQGLARAYLKLGSRAGAGNNLVEASATGVASTADFAASATPGVPNLMVVDSGNNQTGVVGQPLPLPFIAIVTDANNNRLAGVPVTFEVKSGNGSLGGSTTVQTRSDSDGRVSATLTLGPDQGVNNNVVEALLPGSSAFPAAFAATGLVPGPAEQTRISGVVLDNSNNPLPGVTMRLLNINQGNFSNIPQQMAPAVQTDAQGQFVMTQVPVGVFKLMADGGTTTRTGSWPTLDFDMITVSGQNNSLGMPVYLPELNPNNRVCVNETTGGTLTIAEVPGFTLNIAAGSATFPGGSKTGCVSVTPVNMDKVPMSPGFGQQPRFIVTIQPVGTHFNPPASMSIPNVDGLAPRAVTEMYSYDHDLASFVAIGSATVSEDGSTITSDPGAGVIKAGWHCGGNPNATGSAGTCPTCKKCQGSSCVADNAQEGRPVPNDQCLVCKAGAPTSVDTSSWKDDTTLQFDVKLDGGLVNRLNGLLASIPGLNGVKFKEARVGISGRIKDCCDQDAGIRTNGIAEGQATFQLTAEVDKIPLFGTPNIRREIPFFVGTVTVDFQVGAVFATNFRINAQAGQRLNQCDATDNCVFGETNVSIDPEVKLTLEAILCVETAWTTERCGGLTITPLALRINFSGRLTYGKPTCSAGLDGSLALGKAVLRAEFSLDIPAAPERVVIQYELWGGQGQL